MKLSNQEVIVFGMDVGYQFSNTGNGSRKIQTGVYAVRPMTLEEYEDIRREALRSRRRRSSSDRTRKRGYPIFGVHGSKKAGFLGRSNDDYRAYVGEIRYHLAGSERRARVWGTAFLEREEYPAIWETHEGIYVEE